MQRRHTEALFLITTNQFVVEAVAVLHRLMTSIWRGAVAAFHSWRSPTATGYAVTTAAIGPITTTASANTSDHSFRVLRP